MNSTRTRYRYQFKNPIKRGAAACFDAAGSVFMLPVRLFTKAAPRPIQKILAVRIDQLGDAVMVRPALAALRERFPTAEIDFLVAAENAPLFEDIREVREVIPFRKSWFSAKTNHGNFLEGTLANLGYIKAKHYDLAIDFRGDLRNLLFLFLSGIGRRAGWGHTGGGFLLTEAPPRLDEDLHEVPLNLKLVERFGGSPADEPVPFSYSARKKQKFWAEFGGALPPAPKARVVLHLGAGYPSKRWPLSSFQQLAEKLLKAGYQVVLIGTADERGRPMEVETSEQVVDLRGKTGLMDLPILLDHSDLYIGNDSGPAHIAAAQGTPSVILFSGTNDVRYWRPWSPRAQVISHEVPCSPCQAQVCPLGHHDCMKQITVEEVFYQVQKILRDPARVSAVAQEGAKPRSVR